MNVINDIVSSKCYGRPFAAHPRYVVLHATAGSTYAGARAAYEERGVSAHYTVDRNGRAYLNVPLTHEAYHAGQSEWRDEAGKVFQHLNPVSYGIEMVNRNDGKMPYPDAQVRAVLELTLQLCERSSIPAANLLTHAMVSPFRKSDPRCFNFAAFALELSRRLGGQVLRDGELHYARVKQIRLGDFMFSTPWGAALRDQTDTLWLRAAEKGEIEVVEGGVGLGPIAAKPLPEG